MAAERDLFDPEYIAGRTFSKSTRGYRPEEVHEFLSALADAQRNASAGSNGSDQRVSELIAERDALRDRISQLERTPQPSENDDAVRVTELITSETTQVIESARSAAAEIIRKSETEASRRRKEVKELEQRVDAEIKDKRAAVSEDTARIRRETQAEVTKMRAEAEEETKSQRSKADDYASATRSQAQEILRTRTAEAESYYETRTRKTEEATSAMRAEAEEEAETMRRNAEDAAAHMRREAEEETTELRRRTEDEAKKLREDTEAESTEMIAAARAQVADSKGEAERIRAESGEVANRARTEAATAADLATREVRDEARMMVAEARAVREKILQDLVRRRRLARQQIDQARAARDRLIRSIEEVRRQLDEATGELELAVPEARAAMDRVGVVTPSDDDLEVAAVVATLERARPEREEGFEDLGSEPETEAYARRLAGEEPLDDAPPMIDDEASTPAQDAGDEAVDSDADEEALGNGAEDDDTEADEDASDGEDPEASTTGSHSVDDLEPELETSGLAADFEADESPEGLDVEAEDQTASGDARGSASTPAEDLLEADVDAADDFGDGRDDSDSAVEAEDTDEPSGPQGSGVGVFPADEVDVGGPAAGLTTSGVETLVDPQAFFVDDDEDAADADLGSSGSDAIPQAEDDGEPDVVSGGVFGDVPATLNEPEDSSDPEAEGFFKHVSDQSPPPPPDRNRSGLFGLGSEDEAEGSESSTPALFRSTAPIADSATDAEAEVSDESGDLAPGFVARDELLVDQSPELRRQLKRALADDQSDLLDALRRGGPDASIESLPVPERQVARFADALEGPLRASSSAGAEAVAGRVWPGVVDGLVARVAKELVEDVRSVVSDVVGSGSGGKDSGLDTIRTHYRKIRTEQLADLADDALVQAFALGVYNGSSDGTSLRWHIDTRSAASGDCAVKNDGAVVAKPGEFPSGHAFPPCQDHCRCLVLPAES